MPAPLVSEDLLQRVAQKYFDSQTIAEDDPAKWAKEKMNAHLWSKQVELFESVKTHRRTAVQSCHGIGKSYSAGLLACWWIAAHPPGTAMVLSTAPSYRQVHAILWEEIRKHHNVTYEGEKVLPGVVNLSDEWLIGNTLVGFGRKPADYDIHAFQGIHRRYVLVLLDEACGVPLSLWTAAETVTTNEDCRILAIGNPDDPATEFGKVCKPGSGWNVLKVAAEDSPNFTGEPVPAGLSKLLVTREWCEDAENRWGKNSPLYKSKVEGEFPEVSQHALIQPSWILAAQHREMPELGIRKLGVDVARFGTDETVIGLRTGGRFRIIRTLAYSATTTTTGEVIAAQREHSYPVAQVDGVGVGSGVVDQLQEQGYPCIDMQAGGAATKELEPLTGKEISKFKNSRAEWYWHLRMLFEKGLIDIDPADDELAAQLGVLEYKFDSQGKIQILSKEELQKAGHPSPDRADTMMLAFAEPVIVPQGEILEEEDLFDDDDYLDGIGY